MRAVREVQRRRVCHADGAVTAQVTEVRTVVRLSQTGERAEDSDVEKGIDVRYGGVISAAILALEEMDTVYMRIGLG